MGNAGWSAVYFLRPCFGATCIVAASLLGLAGCSTLPDCSEGATDPIDRVFSPLDNAVGKVNQDINNEGESGDCRIIKSSEANE